VLIPVAWSRGAVLLKLQERPEPAGHPVGPASVLSQLRLTLRPPVVQCRSGRRWHRERWVAKDRPPGAHLSGASGALHGALYRARLRFCRNGAAELYCRGDLLEPAASTTPWRVKRRQSTPPRPRPADQPQILHDRWERQAQFDQRLPGGGGEAASIFVSLLGCRKSNRSVPLMEIKILHGEQVVIESRSLTTRFLRCCGLPCRGWIRSSSAMRCSESQTVLGESPTPQADRYKNTQTWPRFRRCLPRPPRYGPSGLCVAARGPGTR